MQNIDNQVLMVLNQEMKHVHLQGYDDSITVTDIETGVSKEFFYKEILNDFYECFSDEEYNPVSHKVKWNTKNGSLQLLKENGEVSNELSNEVLDSIFGLFMQDRLIYIEAITKNLQETALIRAEINALKKTMTGEKNV